MSLWVIFYGFYMANFLHIPSLGDLFCTVGTFWRVVLYKYLPGWSKFYIQSFHDLVCKLVTFITYFVYLYHPLHPVLDHSADYTYYGNSLPQPCPPPSNLSATAWEKTDQKFLPGKVTIHSPAPRCDSLKVRPIALSERKRGYWQLKTGLQRGTYIAEQKK